MKKWETLLFKLGVVVIRSMPFFIYSTLFLLAEYLFFAESQYSSMFLILSLGLFSKLFLGTKGAWAMWHSGRAHTSRAEGLWFESDSIPFTFTKGVPSPENQGIFSSLC